MKVATGRADYDATIEVAGLEPGEPIFIIRAKDYLSASAVRAWAALADVAKVDSATIERALQQADRMDAWPVKKLPDAPDLTDSALKQLRYEFARRRWRSVTSTPPTMGERLAYRQGVEDGKREQRI